ncbi:hypothetical protein V8D89_008725 [Ganoderma adspersum]
MPVPHSLTRRVVGYHLCATVILACTLWLNIRVARDPSLGEWREADFSYIGEDHSPTLLPPSTHLRNVTLITEETVHYWLHTPQDWESMTPAGSGGFVRLGPQKRLFGMAMYHQLHCLHTLQQATAHSNGLGSESDGPELLDNTGGEVRHCLNFLRQMLLCAVNVRLEPLTEDWTLGSLKTDGIGLEHRCRDWTVVRHEVEANIEQWRLEEWMP